MLDTRSNRDADFLPNRPWKTMLGYTQREWLQNGLLRSCPTCPTWKIIVSTVTANMQARPANIDHWMSGFRDEAAIMKEFIASNGLQATTVMITADLHTGGGLDDGCNNGWGIPELSVPHTNLNGGNSQFVGDWTEGILNGTARTAGFGAVTVEDSALTLEVYGRNGTLRHSLALPHTTTTGCQQVFAGAGGQLTTCSAEPVRFLPPGSNQDDSSCTNYPVDEYQSAPFLAADGGTLQNEVQYYRCPDSGIKVMRSNGIPDHGKLHIIVYSCESCCCC